MKKCAALKAKKINLMPKPGTKKVMVDIETFTKMATALPGTIILPHFEKSSFRVNNKIFATLDVNAQRACLKLSLVDQSVFCSIDNTIIYPVANKWGQQGWTLIELKKIRKPILKDALAKAHRLLYQH